MLVYFAYDGSLNGDWVAHYAVRFAYNTRTRTLRLVHVQTSPELHFQDRIARIAEECKVIGVELETEIVVRTSPVADNDVVATALLEVVPVGAMLIAGIRAKPRRSTFLAGSVAARLFEAGRFPVVAMRVVHPGVLGQPGSVLLPLAARTAHSTSSNAVALLRLLGDDLHDVHVLVMRESHRRSRIVRLEGPKKLLAQRIAFAADVEATLRTGLLPHRFNLDSSVVVSNDAAKEILSHAGKYHSRLICLAASERTLQRRLVYGNPVERVLRDTPSDVAIYRSVD